MIAMDLLDIGGATLFALAVAVIGNYLIDFALEGKPLEIAARCAKSWEASEHQDPSDLNFMLEPPLCSVFTRLRGTDVAYLRVQRIETFPRGSRHC